MRISDWSSDVCSSDLREIAHNGGHAFAKRHLRQAAQDQRIGVLAAFSREPETRGQRVDVLQFANIALLQRCGRKSCDGHRDGLCAFFSAASRDDDVVERVASWRSEEHTSELTSLIRISYAVFCLKKKKTEITHNNTLRIELMNHHIR